METHDPGLDIVVMSPPDDGDWGDDEDGFIPPEEGDENGPPDEDDVGLPEVEYAEPVTGCLGAAACQSAGDAPAPPLPPCLAAAIEYAARGWPVLPVHSLRGDICTCGSPGCEHRGKHPIGYLAPHGHKSATIDPVIIQAWWRQAPWANVGVVCGPTSFLALDLDRHREGQDGVVEARRLGWEPAGPVVVTGGNGLLALYAYSAQCRRVRSRRGEHAIAPGVELGGDDSYVVLPPSLHESGRTYYWQSIPAPGRNLPPLPPWAFDGRAIGDGGRAERDVDGKPSAAMIEEGERNESLMRFGCALRRAKATAGRTWRPAAP